MGKSPKPRKNDPALRDLRRWIKVRGLQYEDLEEVWGVNRTGVYKRLQGRVGINMAELEACLGRLGVSPADFYRGVATGFHAEIFLWELEAENPSPVKHLTQYYLGRPPERAYDPEELRAMVAGLESLRFRDRERARTRAMEILRSPDLEPDVEGEAWGVLGVIHRYEGRISVSAHCYGRALRVGGSDRLRAQTWQRIAMLLLFNAGDSKHALEAARWAGACYRRCADMVGVGKTLVDEGIVSVSSGAYQQGVDAYKAGLKLLPDHAVVSRFGAFQGLAIAYVYLGDARQAIEHLDQALAALTGDKSSEMYAAILWLKGEICLLFDQLAKAAKYFLRVRTRYLDLEMALEFTLASLRLAKVYLLQGDSQRLGRILKQMLYQQGEIERSNKVLGAVFGEFLAESARGVITVELLEEIYRKMRSGTEAAPPILPLKLPGSN